MSRINQPVNQVRLTNVAVVRMNRSGIRFEVACYRNKILNYRQKIETDLSEVLQTDRVFTNVSKGQFSSSKDLQMAFGTTDQEAVCQIILDKGQIQVSDMERSATLENTAREVSMMVASKCVHPVSNRPYTISQIREAMKGAEFSVQPTSARSVKQQFLDCVRAIQEKGVLEIQRARMELAIILGQTGEAVSNFAKIKTQLKEKARVLEFVNENDTGGRLQFMVDPSFYRVVDGISKEHSGRLEIVRQVVTEEGDVEVSAELERKNLHQQHAIIAQNGNSREKNSSTVSKINTNKEETAGSSDEDSFGNKPLQSLTKKVESCYLKESNDHYNDEYEGEDSARLRENTRKKNKKANKKSKKAKRREKEEASERQARIEAEEARREEREFRLGRQTCESKKGETIMPNVTEERATEGDRKGCNTCGGSFSPLQYRAHFRSDWHRYNIKLKMKGLAAVDEKEFEMFDSETFF